MGKHAPEKKAFGVHVRGDRVTGRTTDPAGLWCYEFTNWQFITTAAPYVVCCDNSHDTIWKQRWTENMSDGRRIAVAVDPSEHSEKAFDCEFSSRTEFYYLICMPDNLLQYWFSN